MRLSDYKKTFIFVTSALLVLLAVDRIGGMVMYRLLLKSQDTTSPKICYLVNGGCQSDMLLMGTSRCNVHFVPEILEDSLGMTVYNGGVDGSSNIFAHYFLLSSILTYHTPKVICLGVDVEDFTIQENEWESVGFFAPFMGLTQAGDSIFRESGQYYNYQLSHLYRYNAKSLEILSGLTLGVQPEQEKGYMKRPKPPVVPELVQEVPSVKPLDEVKVKYMERFAGKCREKGVELYFIVSPKLTVPGQEYVWLDAFCRKHQIPLLNYHQQGLFQDHPQYFWDISHLWDEGAQAFTRTVAHDLRQLR